MKDKAALFTSNSDEWGTPKDLFEELDMEFEFDLDPCATAENAKCEKYFTKEQDGLKQDWGYHTCFVNCPYSNLKAWVAKCASAAQSGATVVLLIPARTDTKAFHEFIWDGQLHRPKGRVELRLLKGRLKFGDAKNCAPFPSMIVVFHPPA